MEMFTYKIPSVTIRLLTIDTTKKVSYTTSDGLPVRLASSDSFGEMMVRCFSKSGLMSASAPPHPQIAPAAHTDRHANRSGWTSSCHSGNAVLWLFETGLMSASAPPQSSTNVTPADCPSCTYMQT